jgi:formate-dependent nitrite reductase cytochrome c552 subunit
LTNTLIPVRRTLPRDPALTASLRKLDRAIGAANLAMAEPPPAAEPGRAYYVGDKQCVSCHKSADRAWRRSGHAHAWRTLVNVGKQADDRCVGCHSTGYGEVGGSSLGYTDGLTNVQCESCHGPGSTHVEKRGKETPFAGITRTPESVCARCHNEEHSDTFQYEPYLRDALGPGHGELLLDKLGPGPTARKLRRAAAAAARLTNR